MKGHPPSFMLNLVYLEAQKGKTAPQILASIPELGCIDLTCAYLGRLRTRGLIPWNTNMKINFWTPEEDKILLEGVEQRIPHSVIGAGLRRSKNACVARWARLNPHAGKTKGLYTTKPCDVAVANELVIETVPGSLLARVKWLERDDV